MNRQIAEGLLEIGAVFLRPGEPFIWASGIKSPVYCDNRLTLTSPKLRELIENAFCAAVKEHFPACEILMGTSTSGIPHAAIIAHIMGLPMGYVRSGAKEHGRGKQIEGKLGQGQKCVVVEDLISTGGSALETVRVLRDAGADVLGIISIMTYGIKKGTDNLRDADVKNVSLTDFDEIIAVAADGGYIRPEDIKGILEFRDSM